MRINTQSGNAAVKSTKPAGYYDNLNTHLAKLVPPTAKRILEVGCAEGLLGTWLKEQNPSRTVVGIEYEPAIGAKAAQHLDDVHIGDVESMLPLPFPAGSFDCVTFGDVLEHLRDPGAVLRAAREVLTEEGVICVCVPNVSHWSVVAGLLGGDFTYTDNGLLDRTHLRFFTPHTFRNLLIESGFEIAEEQDIPFANLGVTQALGHAASQIGIDARVTEATTTTYQRLFKARPAGRAAMPSGQSYDEMLTANGNSVIVLTYNSSRTLAECLKSVLMTLGPADELIVVDNGSTDGTVEFLEQIESASPQFKIILNGKNLGFSAGCNVGIRAARGKYITLLNPDTVVTPGWIERTKAHFNGVLVGAVGPTSDMVAGLQKVELHVPPGLAGNFSFEGIAKVLAEANAGQSIETKLLIGFCLTVSREALERVGLLDEELFLGADDLDLSWRLRSVGYRLVVARDVFVHHECHVSFATNPESERLNRESVDAFARKLQSHYGEGRVPTSEELFGMDWFAPSFDLWGSGAPAKAAPVSSSAAIPAPTSAESGPCDILSAAPTVNTLPALSAEGLYLDLMKKALVNLIYPEADPSAPTPEHRIEGRIWPGIAHTMVGMKRLENVQACVEHVLENAIPGDLVEAGVWRGGTSIFMRSILKAHGVTDRTVWVCDSFQGLPKPNEELYPADKGDNLHEYDVLAVPVETVAGNFDRYGLLDDQVRFVRGWFKDTLHQIPPTQIAVLRLDGDLYESTMDTLKALYPRLAPGGFVIIDDFGAFPNCRQAIEDYRREYGITEPIFEVDWTGAYWQKQALPDVRGVGQQRDVAAQLTQSAQRVVDDFHRLYYAQGMNGGTWTQTRWMGHNVLKTPNDLWVYQEILSELKPDLIIETGTMHGGSALYFAQMMDLIGHGEIVTIDIEERAERPSHPRITYFTGSSTAPSTVDAIRAMAKGKERVLVVLDSDHSAGHVLNELRAYAEFVTPGSYLIVEDGNVCGHPILLEHGPGPTEAVQAFLQETNAFAPDKGKEKFLFTFNPGGFLRRVS